jgi:hypothetical protein
VIQLFGDISSVMKYGRSVNFELDSMILGEFPVSCYP